MTAKEFLEEIYKGAESGYITVWTRTDKKTAWFAVTEIGSAAAYANKRAAKDDVYFGVALRAARLDSGRGTSGDVSVLPGFWADIDVKNPDAHAQTALPETKERALEFLEALPMKPTITVSSGNGLHVYWLFEKPVNIELGDKDKTADFRKRCQETMSGWQKFVNAEALKRGWKLDNISDLARVLRIADTKNYKKRDKDKDAEVMSVEVIGGSGIRYAPSAFKEYAATAEVLKPENLKPAVTQTEDFSGIVTGSAERMFDGCAFMRYCRDNAKSLTEPYWHAMLTNLALASGGDGLCVKLSKPYPGYNATETRNKIIRAAKEKKPNGCAYIKELLGFDCSGCTARCKAPIALTVVPKAERVKELLGQDLADPTVVFTEEYLDALGYAREKLFADYAVFKAKVKGKVNIPDMERAVKQYAVNHGGKGKSNGEPLVLEGIDLNGAVLPPRWSVSEEEGVKRHVASKDGESEITACPDPVVITTRLVNHDDGKARLELSFFEDGAWKQVIGARTQIYNKATILGFGDTGLHVTSGTAGELVAYLSDYETVNKHVIPRKKSIGRLGWVSPTDFFPYTTKEEFVFEEDSGTANVYKGLREQGDYAGWKAMMKELRKNPFARFLTSASFTAPLLERIHMRTFVIHLWHGSQSGKSAALKSAISAWGNPLRIMGNGYTTVVGTEQLAGTLKHLPFGIDEKQSADEKKISLEHLVYVLGQGSGKIRGAKGGGTAELTTWRNIVMLTGEEPVTKNSSLDGIQTRTLELYGKPFEDIDFATDVHNFSESNYGYAGPEFLRAVCSRLKENPEFLRKEYERIVALFKAQKMKSVHADYIAAITLGDILAETLIFGTDTKVAEREAFENGRLMFENNLTQMNGDTTERAYEFVKGWLVSNDYKFASPEFQSTYGRKQESAGGQSDEYYVIPLYLDEALEKAGFGVAKAIQGFMERGYLVTKSEGDGKRKTVQARINGKNMRVYRFDLSKKDPTVVQPRFTDLKPIEGEELPF
jgi:hypothetical protein